MFADELIGEDGSDGPLAQRQQRLYRSISRESDATDDADELFDNYESHQRAPLSQAEIRSGFRSDDRNKKRPRRRAVRRKARPVEDPFGSLPLAELLEKATAAYLVLRLAGQNVDVGYRSANDLILWETVASTLHLPLGHILAISQALHDSNWREVARNRPHSLGSYVRAAAIRIGQRLQLGPLNDILVALTDEDMAKAEGGLDGVVASNTRKNIYWRTSEARTEETKWEPRHGVQGESQELLFPVGTRYGTRVAPREPISTGPSMAKCWFRVPGHLKQFRSGDEGRANYTLNLAALRFALEAELLKLPNPPSKARAAKLARRILTAFILQATLPSTAGRSRKKVTEFASNNDSYRKKFEAQYRQLENYEHILLKILDKELADDGVSRQQRCPLECSPKNGVDK